MSILVVHVIPDVACTVCGCVCDDLTLHIEEGRVVRAERACELSEPWLLEQDSASDRTPLVAGKHASFESAIATAAKILTAGRAPLLYGLSSSSTAGQRAACRLSDLMGATIDTTASTCHAPSIVALQVVGESTATLGEIKNRADLILYWGSNPLKSHPRHVERYVEATGMFVTGGRKDRHLVVVDSKQTATTEIADRFVKVDPGKDFELIWAIRTLLQGKTLKESVVAGVTREEIVALTNAMKSCRYGTLFFGLGLTQHGVTHANVEALIRLVTDLNSHVRFVIRRMRVPGDVAGADSVLCWQTGFPFSVNLARGYPRYNPGEYTGGRLLEQQEVDAVLFLGTDGIPKLSDQALRHLETIPAIVVGHGPAEQFSWADVCIPTATYGVHRAGTAYRMDEVPIPLRRVLESPLPSDAEVLQKIQAMCST